MSSKKPERTLALFAEQETIRRGPQCLLCKLAPEVRKRIEQARQQDPSRFTFALLANYLRTELGYKSATLYKVSYHLKNHIQ